MSGYHIIYADPPWQYRDRNRNGNRGAECKYSVMTPAQINALPVEDLAAPDSLCFLWSTMPMLPTAFGVLTSWGFDFVTVAFVWVKTSRGTGNHFVGLGHWTRANAELVLLGRRGKPKRKAKNVGQIVECPHPPGPHSTKPPIIREEIVRLCGDLPRVELFARQKVQGWDRWGNDCPCSRNAVRVLGDPR